MIEKNNFISYKLKDIFALKESLTKAPYNHMFNKHYEHTLDEVLKHKIEVIKYKAKMGMDISVS